MVDLPARYGQLCSACIGLRTEKMGLLQADVNNDHTPKVNH